MQSNRMPMSPNLSAQSKGSFSSPNYAEIKREMSKSTSGSIESSRSQAEVPKLRPPPPNSLISYTPAKYATTTPTKTFEASHNFRSPPGLAASSGKGAVDSRSEAKGAKAMTAAAQLALKNEEETGYMGNIPKYFGSTFSHLPNASNRPRPPAPLSPSVPRPFVPQHHTAFADGPLLTNRNAEGKILGGYTKRISDPVHVPYLPVEEPLGPDNPVKQLNDIWAACWDAEAGAVYYYNYESGEATWIAPKL